MAHAHRQGLGVAVMGPVGGGRLGEPSAAIKSLLPDTASSAELALRFVISNPHVSCALSGMSDIPQVEENAVVTSNSSALTDEELGLDFIDYYHFWGIDYRSFQENVLAFGLIEEMLSARDQKLIRHISFSFHGDPEDMIKIIDEGQVFESVLCQYNLLDRSNEQAMAHAHRQGLGVAVMGPVGGGRLGEPSAAIKSLLPDTASSAEPALRFVISNPHVSCALSGMSDISQVEENAVVTSNSSALTDEELGRVKASMEENKRLEELYCTGCDYCMPCPHDVNIPLIFKLMNYYKVYGVTEYAKREYLNIGRLPWLKGKPASACAECGVCEQKCPQAIKIRSQLKEASSALG
jgi:predicted aldo/keto reductase-like oxidoreductase